MDSRCLSPPFPCSFLDFLEAFCPCMIASHSVFVADSRLNTFIAQHVTGAAQYDRDTWKVKLDAVNTRAESGWRPLQCHACIQTKTHLFAICSWETHDFVKEKTQQSKSSPVDQLCWVALLGPFPWFLNHMETAKVVCRYQHHPTMQP